MAVQCIAHPFLKRCWIQEKKNQHADTRPPPHSVTSALHIDAPVFDYHLGVGMYKTLNICMTIVIGIF